MMDETFARTLAVAIAVASYKVRRVPGSEDFEALIREEMDNREIPDSNFEAIRLVADTLLGFADAVRVAERRDHPIVGHFGEAPIPPKGG